MRTVNHAIDFDSDEMSNIEALHRVEFQTLAKITDKIRNRDLNYFRISSSTVHYDNQMFLKQARCQIEWEVK